MSAGLSQRICTSCFSRLNWSSTSSTLKFHSVRARIKRISIQARLCPMQFRGPTRKAFQAEGVKRVSDVELLSCCSQREGSNRRGSFQSLEDRCVAHLGQPTIICNHRQSTRPLLYTEHLRLSVLHVQRRRDHLSVLFEASGWAREDIASCLL